MPTISMFYGIKIEMFHNDHGHPHIHVVYAEHRAKYLIQDISLLEGHLPRRAQELILLWMLEHRTELLENWERARNKKPLVKVAPLE